MDFEWDEEKSQACFTKRGFDFAFSVNAFIDPNRVIHEDTRHTYGEQRFQLMGLIQGRLFVVVYTLRNDSFRIISARKANQRELMRYENSSNKD
jgi:uncharacterized DUF497 family protein